MWDLPASTSEVARQLLEKRLDIETLTRWAGELMAAGHDDDLIVRLAILDTDDWPAARDLTPRVAALFDLDLARPKKLFAWVERALLQDYLADRLDEAELIQQGFEHCYRLVDEQHFNDNPFLIYDLLGDEAAMTSVTIERLAREVDIREWVLSRLIEDGAFQRTGLAAPDPVR